MGANPGDFMSEQESNKAVVLASFDRWRDGTGGPFELLTPEGGMDDCWFVSLIQDV
jgi:hypothetical protein